MSIAKGVDTKATTKTVVPVVVLAIVLAVALVAALAACAGFAGRVSAQSVRTYLNFDARYVITSYTQSISYITN